MQEARADREFCGSAGGIEVQSGRAPQAHPGTAAFAQAFQPQRSLLVGGDGIALETFLLQPVAHWVTCDE
ncbi:hypothetical protein Tther_02036 [Tepidimonas thermarum]|uniref:Uncharacterized protein n=1 Tax=Tepidimonas thermarum TaxID=335431 RepID=A0A554WY63_9BURK|nr:hypothetical protein [Tepidimonas thermarum]TSE28520.1 hypothetical protein Tther_02036 [Tepidimonas thermarum]